VLLSVVTVSFDEPVPLEASVTLAGENAVDGPWLTTGETVADNITVEEKPFMLVKVMLRIAAEPLLTETLPTFVEMLKSRTIINMLKETDNEPAVPLTVAV